MTHNDDHHSRATMTVSASAPARAQIGLDELDDRLLRPIEHTEHEGNTPGRSWARVETSSQASRSPESTRRKRLSFFSRTSIESSKDHPPLSPLTMSSQTDSRPGTARSEVRKRSADPLESIRNSLFRGRRHTSTDDTAVQVIPPRPTSRSVDAGWKSRNSATFRSFKSFDKPSPKAIQDQEKEFYQHRKKSSISPPFNFQHVTHTARKHLPRLETVDEKDLKSKFWQVNAYQKPKEELQEIKADDLDSRCGSITSLKRPVTPKREDLCALASASPRSTPDITRSLDETLFDETQETKFNPDDAYQSLEEVNKQGHSPPYKTSTAQLNAKHYSPVEALATSAPITRPDRSQSSDLARDTTAFRNPPRPGSRQARTCLPMGTTAAQQKTLDLESASGVARGRPEGASFRNKQPLPALPPPSRPESRITTADAAMRSPSYSLFPSVTPKSEEKLPERKQSVSSRKQSGYAPSVQSKRSSRSTRTTTTSKSFGSVGIDHLEEANWEDDIDFAYEQAAEAMCNFDWERASVVPPVGEIDAILPSGRESGDGRSSGTSSRVGGARLSNRTDQPSARTSHNSTSTRQKSDTSVTTQSSANSEAQAKTQEHKRGTSVGHKGFLAARSASTEPLRKTPDFSPHYTSSQAKTPPPKFSLTEAEETVPCSPAFSSSHVPVIDSTIPEYLSDPESDRPGGARHRKSSSYGSFEGSQKSLQTCTDTTRWSAASASSVPDLLHSKRKSRSSMQLRGRMSTPLESVPHSPDAEIVEFFGRDSVVQRDSLKLPPNWERASSDPVPKRASSGSIVKRASFESIAKRASSESSAKRASSGPIVMRRPETASDTTLLLSAGRTIQKSRSSTPSSRNTSRSNIVAAGVGDEEPGWF